MADSRMGLMGPDSAMAAGDMSKGGQSQLVGGCFSIAQCQNLPDRGGGGGVHGAYTLWRRSFMKAAGGSRTKRPASYVCVPSRSSQIA